MFSKSHRRSAAVALALILMSLPHNRVWAQSLSLGAAINQGTLQSTRVAKQAPQPQPRRRCNVKRRLLTGVAVGFLAGVVAVGKAAEANDGSVGTNTKLHAAGYGAALGAGIGLATCRP